MPAAAPRGPITAEAAGGCPCSFFSNADTPGTTDDPDGDARQGGIEVGVRFTIDTGGYIGAIRYYRGATNTGLHLATLWRDTGAKLASGWFRGETASGWQTMTFRSPVAVTPGTYVASYHTDAGGYSSDEGFFAAPRDAGPLHATTGVFAYGASQFPSDSFDATNYWVDVVFDTVVVPAVTDPVPAPGATGVRTTDLVVGGFDETIVPSSLQMEVRGSDGTAVPGTAQFAAPTGSAVFTPSQPLRVATTYTATIAGAVDAAGHPMAAPFSWSFTTGPACPCTLLPDTAAPGTPPSDDAQPVELGLRFDSDVTGAITGVRFFKGAGNDGTHVGELWTEAGQLLASATFTDETATGWQEVRFASPVLIDRNAGYVAAYHTDAGHYAETNDGLQGFTDSGSLHVLPRSPGLGTGGVYAYGPGGTFPGQTFQASDYWVTPVFVPSLPVTSAPDPSTTGQPVAVTATVASTGAAPAGSVLLYAGAQQVGSAPLDGANPGHATFTTTGLPPGSWTLTAIYLGPGVAVGATSFSAVQSVSGPRVAVTETFTVEPSTTVGAGSAVLLTVTLTPVLPTIVAPTGHVQVIEGESGDTRIDLTADPGSNVAHGSALRTIPAGNHPLSALYQGDDHFGSVSVTVVVTGVS